MIYYRAASKDMLEASVREVLDLLEKHASGPLCAQKVAQLKAADPATGKTLFESIAQAATDQELADAVSASGIHSFLIGMADVLEFHACNNTGGTASGIYSRLDSWDGARGARTLEYRPQDLENDTYLACQYARKLAAEGFVSSLKGAFKCVLYLRGEGVRGLKLLKSLVRQVKQGADDAALGQTFAGLDISGRHQLVDAGKIVTNLYLPPRDEETTALRRYVLEVPQLTSGAINWVDPAIHPLWQKVETALEPYWALNEVDMTGVGAAAAYPKKGDPYGVIFNATRRAAETVAEAFAGTAHRVFDGGGKVVEKVVFSPEVGQPVARPKTLKLKPKK